MISSTCPTGKTLQFWDYGDCWLGRYKTYCCPEPSAISECHWVGSGDWVNARCDKSEIELARSSSGGPPIPSSSCEWDGRKKAACCKLGQIESDPATCATDMCDATPGYCPPIDYGDGDDDATLSRREDEAGAFEVLIKRGGSTDYNTPAGGPGITVRGAPYPGPTKLYVGKLALARQAIPLAYRLGKQVCIGAALQIQNVPVPSPPDSVVRAGLDIEHVIDKQVIAGSFIMAMFTGYMPSGVRARLAPIGQSFFNKWNPRNAQLRAFAKISSDLEPRPDTINDRIMFVLGHNGFREPFSLLQKSVNIAKGKLFGLEAVPVDLAKIEDFAADAMSFDTKESADKLLSSIRTGFAVFEYLNSPKVSAAWVTVNLQVRTQLRYIEQVTGIDTLVNWWDAWLADFSATIAANGQDWANRAIKIAIQAIYDSNKAAVDAGRPQAETTAMMLAQLGNFANSIKDVVCPTLPEIPLLPPPSKRDVADEEESRSSVVGLDEEVWERAMYWSKAIPEEDFTPSVPIHGHAHAHAHAHDNHHR